MFGPALFRFLNEEHQVLGPSGWNNPEWDKLWLYNLHYFDDLNAEAAEGRKNRHLEIMRRWVLENPPGEGNGWEPYPISLRVVNWIKWALRGNSLDDDLRQSLAVQVRYLRNRLEHHLLGNHLFANAKALVFAGAFFSGREADGWIEKGVQILDRQIPEQVLEDGGHFERSPMYHAIVLEDLMDLLSIMGAFDTALPQGRRTLPGTLAETARKMIFWLGVMSHPDGGIALFNDAALGAAPSFASLQRYAERLGIACSVEPAEDLIHLRDSGYVRVRKGDATVLIDAAPVGPDYIPGHAHADTLSFEFSLGRQRVIVDSGTFGYGNGAERQRQRSTAAHNTVTINEEDSSEVWGGFRVARRARPFGLEIRNIEDMVFVNCSHDGYRRLPGSPVHQRRWFFREDGLTVKDLIHGGFREAAGRFYIHPEVKTEIQNNGEGVIQLPNGERIKWRVTGGEPVLKPSTYHPEFGYSIPNQCLEIRFRGPEVTTTFAWK